MVSDHTLRKVEGDTMEFEDLTLEQRQKALACKTPDDLLALAKEEGYELSEEELKAVSGGAKLVWSCSDHTDPCPKDLPDWC